MESVCLGEENLYYSDVPTRPVSANLQANPELSRSVPGIPAATQDAPHHPNMHHHHQQTKTWTLRYGTGPPPFSRDVNIKDGLCGVV